MKAILKFFKSVRLAVVLILYITLTSILATLIPQGRETSFYYDSFPSLLAGLIIFLQFHDFFKSFLFLAPSLLFFINLSVCAVDRLVRELRGKAKMRIGVDLVHLGLILLMLGSVVTFAGRREGFRYLGEGDQLSMPGEFILHLKEYRFERYPDGRPKDWISTVDVEKNGKKIIDSYDIEVNRPLKIGDLEIFQSSFGEEYQVVLKEEAGDEFKVSPGQFFEAGGSSYRLKDIVPGVNNPTDFHAAFEKWEGHRVVSEETLPSQGKIGELRVAGITTRALTGLQFVIDPGYIPVIISLILIAVGLSITYIRRIGERTP